jgi:hypothetical protein
MSLAQTPQMPAAAAPPPRLPAGSVTSPLAEGHSANLTATAQYLVFEPGLYAIDVIAERSIVTEMGLVLPSVRLEPAPPTRQRPGRISVIDPVATGWLSQHEEATFALAVGGRAGAIMTVYRARQGVPVPEIRIRALDASSQPAPDALARHAPPDADAPEAAPDAAAPDGSPAAALPLSMLCHISRVGDVPAAADGWLGQRGSGAPIEGFSVAPAEGAASLLRPEDIEYQGILGNHWKTPWIPGGAFCGSRGMMLPLLGLCVRLKGAAAAAFTLSYDARFTDGQETRHPCPGGEFCRAGDVPLEAFRVVIAAREPAAAARSDADQAAPVAPAPAEARPPATAAAAPAERSPSGRAPLVKPRTVLRMNGRRTTLAVATAEAE